MCCVSYPGALSGIFLFWVLGGVDPKKFLEPRSCEKNFLRLVEGPGAYSPEDFEKIVFRIG